MIRNDLGFFTDDHIPYIDKIRSLHIAFGIDRLQFSLIIIHTIIFIKEDRQYP